jgi:hypothetical protein
LHLHNTSNKRNQETLKHAKPKHKNIKTCTNQTQKLMKQPNNFKNITNSHKKKNDIKKARGKQEHLQCKNKSGAHVM